MSPNVHRNKTMAWLWGMVHFYKPRKGTQRYLTPDSFTAKSGECPVNWNHWLDSDYVFQEQASWLVFPAGVLVMHYLDLTQEPERKVYGLALTGQLELSHGRRSTPQKQRQAIAQRSHLGLPLPKKLPLKNEFIGHWSYAPEGAFPQEPVKIILEL